MRSSVLRLASPTLAAALVLASCAAHDSSPPAPPRNVAPPATTDEEAWRTAAREWLAMVDGGDFARAWEASSPTLREKVDQPAFVRALGTGRAGTGVLRSRAPRSSELADDPPRAPPGHYAVLTFDARYEAMPEAIDRLLVRREADGRWRVLLFHTEPAPCREATSAPSSLPTPPSSLGLDPFYVKYVDAGGIPVVSSSHTRDAALRTASAIVGRMLRKRPDIGARLVAEGVHVAVMSPTEQTLDLPEQKGLVGIPTDTPGVGWNERARGLGGTLVMPVTSCGEENLLCMPCDRYAGGNVLVHEFGHIIEQVGLVRDPAFRRGLRAAFANATARGLFQGAYPSTSAHEYWAVGVQSWFEANQPSERRSRAELARVDPPLTALLAQVFDDDDWRFSCSAIEPPLRASPPAPLPVVQAPRACPDGMVSVAGGAFPFGPAEVVQPFCMDASEVTVARYAACVRAGRCTPAGSQLRAEGISEADRALWSASCNGDRADRAHHPVNCVDWTQATTYCRAQGKRLPTEQEWEWAARGGARAWPYPWGWTAPSDQLCWSGSAKRSDTCEVGSFPAGDTPEGIHDLAGNVWEWTAESGDDEGHRLVKGSASSTDQADQVRVTARDDGPPDLRAHIGGFRCVR